MILASIDPTRLHTDPTPILDPSDGFRIPEGEPRSAGWLFQPRSQFIPTTTHQHNPILDMFGRSCGRTNLYTDNCSDWLSIIDVATIDGHPKWTVEQLAHARKVISRLRSYIRHLERAGVLA